MEQRGNYFKIKQRRATASKRSRVRNKHKNKNKNVEINDDKINAQKLFAALHSLEVKIRAIAPISPDQEEKLRAEVHRLIEIVPVDSKSGRDTLLIKAVRNNDADFVRHL